jgi:hypothetical protein
MRCDALVMDIKNCNSFLITLFKLQASRLSTVLLSSKDPDL